MNGPCRTLLVKWRDMGDIELVLVAARQEGLVPWPPWPRLPGVRSHQTTWLPESHRTSRLGVPVTTPPRTLADLSGMLPATLLGRVVDDSLRRGILRREGLRRVHADLAASTPSQIVADVGRAGSLRATPPLAGLAV